jgi:hypothetical protein
MESADADTPTTQLCIAGMTVDGDAALALPLFEQAWDARRDTYDATVAAHFLARHQRSPALTLHWNRVAIAQALMAAPERVAPLLASLYLNMGDSCLTLGDLDEARRAAELGVEALAHLPPGGYRDFVAMGLERLSTRIHAAR